MTTTTYIQGSNYGVDELMESIYYADGNIDEKMGNELAKQIVKETNKNLPGTYNWIPWTSEIHVSIDESEDLTEEQFMDIKSKTFDIVMDKFWKTKWRVSVSYYRSGSGYSHTEVMETLDEYSSAEEWYKTLEHFLMKDKAEWVTIEIEAVDDSGDTLDYPTSEFTVNYEDEEELLGMTRPERSELTDAYARHLYDEFGVDCGLYHDGSDMDLNFEDFDECIRNTPKDQLTDDYYRWAIEDFVEEMMGV